jgi:uncharacterized membrane protein
MIADEKERRISLGRGDEFERLLGHGERSSGRNMASHKRVDTRGGMRHEMPMRFVIALAVAALTIGEAHAGLSLCNKARRAATVALGRFDGTAWMSEGWWTIAPSKCESLIRAPLLARFYYLYATDGGAGSWSGTKSFCTATKDKFSIVGRDHCTGRGYDRRAFFEVDTGQSANYTQSLSD